jgi:pimeloyl-ACP methyl ester carboxylesterase
VLPLLSFEYHALAPDQRGHGDLDKPTCCYTADDCAADVDAFMEALGLEKATLVGHSSGGLIAQRVALSYPHRIGRLVQIGSPVTLVHNEAVAQAGRRCSRWKILSQKSSSGGSWRARSTTLPPRGSWRGWFLSV